MARAKLFGNAQSGSTAQARDPVYIMRMNVLLRAYLEDIALFMVLLLLLLILGQQ